MQGGIDRHVLPDSIGVGVSRFDFPAFLELHQGKPIGSVAVHLVRGRENEHRVRRRAPALLEHDCCPVRVHRKIGGRIQRCPIVRGLRRGVHDERNIAAVLPEDLLNCGLVAYVHGAMRVALAKTLLQTREITSGRCIVAKEFAAHVVVDADDLEASGLCEENGCLGADEAGGSADDRDAHWNEMLHRGSIATFSLPSNRVLVAPVMCRSFVS